MVTVARVVEVVCAAGDEVGSAAAGEDEPGAAVSRDAVVGGIVTAPSGANEGLAAGVDAGSTTDVAEGAGVAAGVLSGEEPGCATGLLGCSGVLFVAGAGGLT